jgi:hypothetical protein
MMPDKKFPIIWSAWLLMIMISFAVIEGLALAWGDTTLSRYTWEVYLAWPPIAVVYGAVFFGLAVHFFWHWSPPGSSSEG